MSSNEVARISALHDYRVLDTPAEEVFDNITRLTARLFKAPIALVTLVDAERQWFKSRFGLLLDETAREHSFCSHTIADRAPLLVPDARSDARFSNNPLVTEDPGIRFYCGVPLLTPDGHGLGALCVIDREPRSMGPAELRTLSMLGRQVELELEIRRQLWLLNDALKNEREQRHSKELLAGMLVHDLRSPLTTLTLLASSMNPADEDSRSALEEMLAEADRMRRMLKDVLDICLHEVGQLTARRSSFPLRPFAETIVRRLDRIGERRQQRILLEFRDAPETINVDPDLIERVLETLLINAIDHGPPQQPITVNFTATDQGWLRGAVCDAGPLIAETARAKLFRPFERLSLDNRPAEVGMGRGLGLAFCRLAVEAHAGRVGISAAGGNCFYFELPIQ
jgi:signal transduction histidine kinase